MRHCIRDIHYNINLYISLKIVGQKIPYIYKTIFTVSLRNDYFKKPFILIIFYVGFYIETVQLEILKCTILNFYSNLGLNLIHIKKKNL